MPKSGEEFQFDRGKFKELALYIAWKCPPEKLGAVKYNKVLYYSDMFRYVMTGQPITGATYRRRRLGPTTDQLLSALRELTREGGLAVSEVSFYGFVKKEYRARRKPDMDVFNAEEISLVDDVIKFVCEDHTAAQISEFSHNLAWEATEQDGVIPYFSAFLMGGTAVSEEALLEGEKGASQIEAERQKRNPLDYPLFEDLRTSV